LVPQLSAKRRVPDQFSIGRMPGTMGALIPALAQASRNRKQVSTSKQTYESASDAPAALMSFTH